VNLTSHATWYLVNKCLELYLRSPAFLHQVYKDNFTFLFHDDFDDYSDDVAMFMTMMEDLVKM
jgi:hypothetical protein